MIAELVRIQGMYVAPVAEDFASRARLYGGLALGLAVIVAGSLAVTLTDHHGHAGSTHDQARSLGYEIGYHAGPVGIAGALVFLGFQNLREAKRLARIALAARTEPQAAWLLRGFELCPLSPHMAKEQLRLTVKKATRTELLKKPRLG